MVTFAFCFEAHKWWTLPKQGGIGWGLYPALKAKKTEYTASLCRPPYFGDTQNCTYHGLILGPSIWEWPKPHVPWPCPRPLLFWEFAPTLGRYPTLPKEKKTACSWGEIIGTHLRTNDSTRAVRSWRDNLSFFLVDSGCSSKAAAWAKARDSRCEIGVTLTLAGTTEVRHIRPKFLQWAKNFNLDFSINIKAKNRARVPLEHLNLLLLLERILW